MSIGMSFPTRRKWKNKKQNRCHKKTKRKEWKGK
jgi:hypothetical protein